MHTHVCPHCSPGDEEALLPTSLAAHPACDPSVEQSTTALHRWHCSGTSLSPAQPWPFTFYWETSPGKWSSGPRHKVLSTLDPTLSQWHRWSRRSRVWSESLCLPFHTVYVTSRQEDPLFWAMLTVFVHLTGETRWGPQIPRQAQIYFMRNSISNNTCDWIAMFSCALKRSIKPHFCQLCSAIS